MKKYIRILLSAWAIISILFSCETAQQNYIPIKKEAFQLIHEGKQIDLFTLKNAKGMIVQITNYG